MVIRSLRKRLVNLMSAVTFAEARLPDTAREFLHVTDRKAKAARPELPDVKV